MTDSLSHEDALEAEELGWLSLAYLHAGIFLARSIVDEDFEPSIHRSRVPLFLIHQALELLFKCGSLVKRGKYPASHHLSKLHKQFIKDYPELRFEIPPYVLGADVRTLELFPNDPATKVAQHERLRYPSDRTGRLWLFDDDFDLAKVIDEIEDLNVPVQRSWHHLVLLRDHDEA